MVGEEGFTVSLARISIISIGSVIENWEIFMTFALSENLKPEINLSFGQGYIPCFVEYSNDVVLNDNRTKRHVVYNKMTSR